MTKIQELNDYVAKYPKLSPILILKISVTKNGIIFTDKALARLQGEDYRFTKAEPFGIQLDIRQEDFYTPGAVYFRDGSSVLVNLGEPYKDPYVVEYDDVNEEFLLTEGENVVDIIDFIPRPAFFDGVTSCGTHMDYIGGTCTGQRLLINGFQRCRFWENKEQCHYCALFSADSVLDGDVNLEDIYETVHEMLQEPGRFTEISVSGGSDFSGDPPFSNEVERYIRVLNAVSRDYEGKLETQLQAPAYKKEDIKKIYDNTCLTSYRPNIEVWDKASFERMCPGKDRWIGRDEWIKRMCDSVEVFGKGRVYTQMVCGAEMAKPLGMTSVDQAVDSAIEGAEFFSSHGISCHEEIWRPHKREKLGWQDMQELDYFIRIAEGFHDARQRHGICDVETNYMRGSDNPDADIERGDLAADIPVAHCSKNLCMEEAEYTALPIDNKLAQMITDGAAKLYIQVDENSAFELKDALVLSGSKSDAKKYLMIPLESDRSTLSAFLTRCVWFKTPVKVWAVCESESFCMEGHAFKHMLVGQKFRKVLDCYREKYPLRDMLACCEIHADKIVKADMPKLELRDWGVRFAHRHLDRQ